MQVSYKGRLPGAAAHATAGAAAAADGATATAGLCLFPRVMADGPCCCNHAVRVFALIE